MGVDTEKYLRKPLFVDAVRVNAQNFDTIAEWCGGEVQVDEQPGSGTTKKYIKVRVHNPKNPRQTKAFIGDWLLYNERGYKVYTNKAFRSSFDSVEGDAPEIKPPTGAPRELSEAEKTLQELPKFYFAPHSDELTDSKPHKGAVPLTLPELMNIISNELVGEELQNTTRPEQEPVKEELPPQPRRVGPQVQIDDKRAPEPVEAEESAQAEEDIKLVPESPEMKEARELIEADGGTVEPATPEGISQAARENEQAQAAAELAETGVAEMVRQDEEERLAEGKSETVDEIIESHPEGVHAGMSEAAGETPTPQYPEETTIGGIPREEINVGEPPTPPVPDPVSEQPPEQAAAGKRVLSKAEQDRMGPEAVRDLLMEGDVILEQDLAA